MLVIAFREKQKPRHGLFRQSGLLAISLSKQGTVGPRKTLDREWWDAGLCPRKVLAANQKSLNGCPEGTPEGEYNAIILKLWHSPHWGSLVTNTVLECLWKPGWTLHIDVQWKLKIAWDFLLCVHKISPLTLHRQAHFFPFSPSHSIMFHMLLWQQISFLCL